MKNKFLFALIFSFTLITSFAQKQYSKEDVSNNWMFWNVKTAQSEEKTSRLDMNKEPKPDFIINSDGTYNISFENMGIGTWRLEDNFIFFWGKDSSNNRTMVQLIAKIILIDEERFILKFINPSRIYDWDVTLVPFN